LFTLPISSPSELLLVPNLLPGDRGIVGSAGAFVRIRDSGKIALSTTDNGKTNGNSVFLEVAPDGFRVVTPWGRIILDQWGFRVVLPSGGEINLMTFNGGPVKSAFIASADSVELDAQNVSLGPGPTDNAVKLNPILAIIAALQKPAAVGVPPLDPATALLLIAQLEQSGVAL
jgi:hypothetical protein